MNQITSNSRLPSLDKSRFNNNYYCTFIISLSTMYSRYLRKNISALLGYLIYYNLLYFAPRDQWAPCQPCHDPPPLFPISKLILDNVPLFYCVPLFSIRNVQLYTLMSDSITYPVQQVSNSPFTTPKTRDQYIVPYHFHLPYSPHTAVPLFSHALVQLRNFSPTSSPSEHHVTELVNG